MDPLLEFWSKFDGKAVKIDGLNCKIRVSSYWGKYPCKRLIINVDAVPTPEAMKTEFYRNRRAELGDDWFTDILNSEPEFQEKIFMQL